MDERVAAIVPFVIDMLNVRPSFIHHWEAYRFLGPGGGRLRGHGHHVVELTRHKYKKLMKIVEPFEHRDRLADDA